MRCQHFSVFVPGVALSFALVIFSSIVEAQTVTVTFNLNMANETVSPDGPHLAGGADFGLPGDNPMSDPDGDNVWTITVDVAVGYTGYYTFTNGACPDWGCKENIAGQDCANPENYNDRQLENITENTVINTCFGQCTTDGSCATVGEAIPVTFQVDMSEQDILGPIYVTGSSVDGWCGTCVEMTDADGDNVFEATVELDAGDHEYKFNNGGWDGTENLDSAEDSTCTLTTVDGQYTFVHRLFTLAAGAGDVTLDVVCFNSCDECEVVEVPDTEVTFNVDMSEQTVSGAVYISGESIDGWAGSTVEMIDADGDSVYSVTLELPQGNHEYKYMIGSWNNSEQLDEVEDAECTLTTFGFTNRLLVISSEDAIDLDVVCYESCGVECVSDPDPAIFGCTVSSACNYNPVATTEDGSCVYPAETWLDCNGQCLEDLDGNGVCDNLEGSILFQEDFANGFDGNNGVGPLIAEDTSPSTTIWQWVSPDGNGYYPDGSASGVQPPAGDYSPNIGALNSATADNGWVIFDGDFYNTPISNGVEDVEGTLSLPTLDFSGATSVVIEWDQYFRYCCYPWAPLFIEVSSDGGSTWTSFEAKGEFLESANTLSENPLHTTVDIGCAAAEESAVDIRFAWRQHPNIGEGYSHYYWGLDDIVIRENPVSMSMEIAHVFTGDIINDFAYSIVPLSQVIGTGDGGLLAQVHHRNTGSTDITGAVIEIDILDSIGQVVQSIQTAPFTSVAQANVATCSEEDIALLDIPTGWAPDGVGEYTVRATMTAPDYPNALPVDQPILFTECRFGHDDESAFDQVLTPRESDDVPDLYEPTGYGSRFTFEEAGQHVYGIEVAFGPELGHQLDFEIRWIEQDPTNNLTDSPYEFAEFVTDSAWASNPDAPEFTSLYFDQPLSVNTNSFYAAAVITELEWDKSLEVLANADSDFDESTIVFQQTGYGDFGWFTGQSSTPAIRLITCVSEPLEGCTDPAASNYAPYASVDDGTCTYPVSGCTDPEAVNYNPLAVIEDGSCIYGLGCVDIGSGAFAGQPLGLYPIQSMGVAGIPMDASIALHVPSMVEEEGTGTTYAIHSFVPSGYGGDEVPGISLPTLPGTMEGNQQACLDLVGTPLEAGDYEVEVVGDLYISVFGSPFLAGEFALPHTVVIEANPNPIPGCTYTGAANFSPLANDDDGSCLIEGCTDSQADNYHPIFNADDGTCEYGDGVTGGNSECPSDLNGDELIGVSDLLVLLGEFGLICTP